MEMCCRICLIESIELDYTSIDCSYEEYENLAEVIEFVSGIRIFANDNLPQKVCSKCLSEVITAAMIKETCINSDKFLRSQQCEEFNEIVKTEPETNSYDSAKEIELINVKQEPDCCVIETNSIEENRVISKKKYPDNKFPQNSTKSPRSSSYKCHFCDEIFLRRKDKESHLESVHRNDDFKCRICRHRSLSAKGHDNHLMIHENPGLLSHMCHICSRNYQKACDLRRHIKLTHSDKSKREKKFLCDVCGLKTFLKMNMARHIRTVHLKIKAYQCEFCVDKRFSSKTSMEQHKITQHGFETDFVCRCCTRKFPTMSFLRSHMKFCSGSPGSVRHRVDPNSYREQIEDTDFYRCKICNFVVEGKVKIAQHYAQRHKHNNACDLCPATFNSYSNLKKHIQILHNKIHKFTCSFCGKSFGQKNQLKSHENTHTGAKPFTCKFDCHFRSGDLSSVSKHQKKCLKNPMNQITQ